MSVPLQMYRRFKLVKCFRRYLRHQAIFGHYQHACGNIPNDRCFVSYGILIRNSPPNVALKSRLKWIQTCTRHYNMAESSAQMTPTAEKAENSNGMHPEIWSTPLEMPEPEFDWEYLCERNISEIKQNIINRKGIGNMDEVVMLQKAIQRETNLDLKKKLECDLRRAAAAIPNRSSPHSPIGDESNAKLVGVFGQKKDVDYEQQTATVLGQNLNLLRNDNVINTTGSKSYYFLDNLAQLEQALIKLAVDKLLARGFELVTVPEVINPAIIEACGFITTGDVTQVYNLDKSHGDQSLIGTAEMPLAGHWTKPVNLKYSEYTVLFLNTENTNFTNKFRANLTQGNMFSVAEMGKLPGAKYSRLCSVSRCYRAEVSNEVDRHSIYRVHQFSKVEMFGMTGSETGEEAELLLQEFVEIEKEIFSDLGLHFRILEMPTHELGAPAYRKFDIEAWLPGVLFWGEISSASNCTDYQSRRLNSSYKDKTGQKKYVHTVNGTACAIPRLVMAIFENFQNKDGTVNLPDILQPYMDGKKTLTKSSAMPNTNWIKYSRINWES